MTGSPGRRPTLEEVARLAGVGRGTASRVINGSSQVSEGSRLAVEEAIVRLGYVPNPAARALVTRRTQAIALVIAESEERIFGEPFFAGVVRGISAAVSAAQMQLVLLLSQADQRAMPFESYLTGQHVDGVLLLSVHDQGSAFVIHFLEVDAHGDPTPLEHSALGWFTPEELSGLPLAPADARFVTLLRQGP